MQATTVTQVSSGSVVSSTCLDLQVSLCLTRSGLDAVRDARLLLPLLHIHNIRVVALRLDHAEDRDDAAQDVDSSKHPEHLRGANMRVGDGEYERGEDSSDFSACLEEIDDISFVRDSHAREPGTSRTGGTETVSEASDPRREDL